MTKTEQSKLAHELTVQECEAHRSKWQVIDPETDESSYTELAQEIYNNYYDLIESVVEVKED